MTFGRHFIFRLIRRFGRVAFAPLCGLGFAIGVVTSKSQRSWQISSRFVFLPNIDCWIFSDDVDYLKPAPDGIL